MVSVEQGKRMSITSLIPRHTQKNYLYVGMKGPLLHDSHRWVQNGMMSRCFYWHIYDMFRLWAVPHFFYKIWSHIFEEFIEFIDNFYRVIYLFSVRCDWFQSISFLFSFAQYFIYCIPRFPDVWSFVVKFLFVVRYFCFSYRFLRLQDANMTSL